MNALNVFARETWGPALSDLAPLLPRLGTCLAVLVAFWLAGKVSKGAINRLGRGRKVDPDVTALIAQSAHVAMLLFGVVTALGTLGVDVSALVAGLGLTGLALGLALKEIISNALAGFLIMLYKPFRRGDYLAVVMPVPECRGTVTEVNLRYTALEGEKGKIFVPNTMLLSNAVVVGPAPLGNVAPSTPSRPD